MVTIGDTQRHSEGLPAFTHNILPETADPQPVQYMDTGDTTDQPARRGVPDGGWGWVIVVVSGLLYVYVLCFEKTITFFYQQLRLKFPESSAAETAAVMSVTTALKSFAGPLAAFLIHLVGHKAVGLLACALMAASYLCAMLAPAIMYLYFTYSILKGVSIAMIVVTMHSVIAVYFDKNKGKAMGFNSCFIALGGLLAPLWLSKSYEEYGYFGTMMIMIGMTLHIIPASLSFRPLENNYKNVTATPKGNKGQPEIVIGPPKKQYTAVELDKAVALELLYQGKPETSSEHTRDSSYEVARVAVQGGTTTHTAVPTCCSRFLVTSGLADLTTPRVLCHMVMCSSVAVVHGISLTFTAGLAMEKGFAVTDVKFVVSLVYGAEVVWRVAAGLLLDYFSDHRPLVYTTITFLLGCLGILLPLITQKVLLMCVWVVFQGLLANGFTHVFTIAGDLVPRSRATAALGLARFFMGFGYLVGPLTGGILKDMTGSFRLTFQIAGSQMVVFSTLLLIMDIRTAVSKTSSCSRRKQSEEYIKPQ